jgi:hypothetical protein
MTPSIQRLRNFFINFGIGLAFGFIISYVSLGGESFNRDYGLAAVARRPIAVNDDPHDEHDLDGVKGPVGDVQFHDKSETVHQGMCLKLICYYFCR